MYLIRHIFFISYGRPTLIFRRGTLKGRFNEVFQDSGLCINTSPEEAIKLVWKQTAEIASPPLDEMDWFDKRAKQRGVDISPYK